MSFIKLLLHGLIVFFFFLNSSGQLCASDDLGRKESDAEATPAKLYADELLSRWRSDKSNTSLIHEVIRNRAPWAIGCFEAAVNDPNKTLSEEALHELRLGLSVLKSETQAEKYGKRSADEFLNSYSIYLKSSEIVEDDEMEFWVSPSFWADSRRAWRQYRVRQIRFTQDEWKRFRDLVCRAVPEKKGSPPLVVTRIDINNCDFAACIEIDGEPIGIISKDVSGTVRFDSRGVFLMTRTSLVKADDSVIIPILRAKPEIIAYCIRHSEDGFLVHWLLECCISERILGIRNLIKSIMVRPLKNGEYYLEGLRREDLAFFMAITSENANLPLERIKNQTPLDLIKEMAHYDTKNGVDWREFWVTPGYPSLEEEWKAVLRNRKNLVEYDKEWILYLERLKKACIEIVNNSNLAYLRSADIERLAIVQASGGERFYLYRDIYRRWRFAVPQKER